MGIASLAEERWSKKISEWNPGLDSSVKTSRPVERPRIRWEDEINEFFKSEESEKSKGNDLKHIDTWIRQAEKQKEWKIKEEEFSKKQQQQKIQGSMSLKSLPSRSTLHYRPAPPPSPTDLS